MSAALKELIMSGVYESRRISKVWPCSRWSGAAILGGKVIIATMNRAPDGCWSRDEARSREFELAGRNQASACQLHSTLGEFLRRSHISRIFLRASSGGGPYRARAESHMCTTLLYLRGGVVIHDVSPNSLASWMREQGWDFDGQARNRGWDLAAAAAIYAAGNLQNMRDAGRAAARASP